MNFRLDHDNINVFDLERSLKFYNEALGMTEKKRNTPEDGAFIIAYLGDNQTAQTLELTWLRGHEPYDLGDNESHIAFRTDDFEAAHKKHSEMGCICFENTKMGIYFIEDPDGYWLEILPIRK